MFSAKRKGVTVPRPRRVVLNRVLSMVSTDDESSPAKRVRATPIQQRQAILQGVILPPTNETLRNTFDEDEDESEDSNDAPAANASTRKAAMLRFQATRLALQRTCGV